jgi:hypothetical protein
LLALVSAPPGREAAFACFLRLIGNPPLHCVELPDCCQIGSTDLAIPADDGNSMV